jgi:hypothetical protein
MFVRLGAVVKYGECMGLQNLHALACGAVLVVKDRMLTHGGSVALGPASNLLGYHPAPLAHAVSTSIEKSEVEGLGLS